MCLGTELCSRQPIWGSRPDQHGPLSQALALGSITHLSIALSVRGSSELLPLSQAYEVANPLHIMLVPSIIALPQSEANYLEAGRFCSSLPGYEPVAIPNLFLTDARASSLHMES